MKIQLYLNILLALIIIGLITVINLLINDKNSPPRVIITITAAIWVVPFTLISLVNTAVFMVLKKLKSPTIFINALLLLSICIWGVIMYFNPRKVSFDEVYLAWLAIAIINLGVSIWALVATKDIPKLPNESILDDDFIMVHVYGDLCF